jgi:excisionase family DNA binding protein
MAQGYYTLEEAAQILGMSPDELKQIARKGEVRSFQDRGNWRFRNQDIDEMARRRGLGSDPELVLGDIPPAKPTDSPAPKSPMPKTGEGEVFNFTLDPGDEQVEIGREPLDEAGGSKKGTKSGPRSGPKSGPHSPKPGSGSDVRLVAEQSGITFGLAKDSDVKMVHDSSPSKPSSKPPSSKSKMDSKRKTGVPTDDSGVRLVGVKKDSDSDVKIVGVGPEDSDVPIGGQPPKTATDSDIRLDIDPSRPGSGEVQPTDEIDLDLERRQFEQAQPMPQAKIRSKAPTPPPATSPFELSEDDLTPAAPTPEPEAKKDDSSDFDLTPTSEKEPSPLEVTSSDEFELELSEDSEVSLGSLPSDSDLKGPDSGINLQNPADSGISLEQGGEGSDELEFELTLDAESTPKPAPAPEVDSDSEFELTLDDSGALAPLEEGAGPPKSDEERDIFETDFEVPALDEESGSEAVAISDSDTDLESSDFDLAISDEDIAADEESGSQVLALDEEEEVEEGAATVTKPAKKARGKKAPALEEEVEEEESIDELFGKPEEEEEEEEVAVREVVVAAPPAPWGPWPTVMMLPCVVVLCLVGLLGFEMIQSMITYKPPGMLTRTLAGLLGQKM